MCEVVFVGVVAAVFRPLQSSGAAPGFREAVTSLPIVKLKIQVSTRAVFEQ